MRPPGRGQVSSSRFSPPWMIKLNLAQIESMHSTSDDRVERGTNQLDFHKIESMHVHSTSDDRVKRGTNRIDFADYRVDIIAICRRKDSIFESTILRQTAHHNKDLVYLTNTRSDLIRMTQH